MKNPQAWLGLLPLGCYAIIMYTSYRLPHIRSGGFIIWVVGWSALGLYVIMTSAVRVSVVMSTVYGGDTFRLWRLLVRLAGDVALMIFVLCVRQIFPSDQSLWDDVKADARRLARWLRWMVGRLVALGNLLIRLYPM